MWLGGDLRMDAGEFVFQVHISNVFGIIFSVEEWLFLGTAYLKAHL